jgi:hypothetical protein
MFFHKCFRFLGKFGQALKKNWFLFFPISSEKTSKFLVSENWKKIIAGGW